MRWGKAALEQQAHRIAFIAKCWLQADEDIAKMLAQNEHRPPVGLYLAGRSTPDSLDLRQRLGVAHNRISRHKFRYVCRLSVDAGIALQHFRAQIIHCGWHVDQIAIRLHAQHGVVQTFKHAQIRRCSGSSGVWWKAEQHDADLFARISHLAQIGQTQRLFGQNTHPFMARRHRFGQGRAFAHLRTALAAVQPMTARKDCGVRRPVDLRQRNQHRRFNRPKAGARLRPLAKGLKFQRMCRNIGHVQRFQRLNRRVTVIVSRAANKAKPGQRYHGVNGDAVGILKKRVDRRAAVKPACKGRNAGDTARFKAANDSVIMCCV